MKKLVNLNDLMVEQMRDIYDGERRVHEMLLETASYASHPRLSTLLQHYIDLIEEQEMRIRQVFENLYTQKRGEKSRPIFMLIEQFNDLIKRCEDLEILDAVIIVNLQHIIHYKIASYGAICTYLKHLGLNEEAEIIHQNLEIEKTSDRQFAMIADAFIDKEAIAPSTIQ